MKKKFTIILLVATLNFELLTLNCFAQPNGGFENWHAETSYQVPDKWQTWNFMSLAFPANPLSAFKATGIDKHSGNYALKLKTVFMNNNFFHDYISDTTGGIFTGKINISPPSYQYGFPYTGRPSKLEFWSKYTPVGNDSGGAVVFLKKWNGAIPDTIAVGVISIPTTLAYTLFHVNLTYLSNYLPDSAIIAFTSSKWPPAARQNSTLYIDDVEFTGWVGMDEPLKGLENKVILFPNPTKENVNIQVQIEEADNIQVIDASAKLIGNFKILNHVTTINTSGFATGTYLYDIRDKNDKILSKSKFNVVK